MDVPQCLLLSITLTGVNNFIYDKIGYFDFKTLETYFGGPNKHLNN